MRDVLKCENELVYSRVIKDKDWVGYGFKMENPELIEPISINGKLSLWDFDYNSRN